MTNSLNAVGLATTTNAWLDSAYVANGGNPSGLSPLGRAILVEPFEPEEKARCAPGDVVFVAKMSGFVAAGPKDGKMYRLVNDRDVFAKVTWFGEDAS